MTRRLNTEEAASENHPQEGGVPAGIHVPGGRCSKIKIQINTSAVARVDLTGTVSLPLSSSRGNLTALLSKACGQAAAELPPPKTLERQSAAIHWGELSPPGSPRLLCHASHRPGAPCLLVPSGRRAGHYGNRPRSMRPFCGSSWHHRCGPSRGCTVSPALATASSTNPLPPVSPARLPTIPTPPGPRAPSPGLPDYQEQGLRERGKGRRRGGAE